MKHVNPFQEERATSAEDLYRVLDRMCEALGVEDHAGLALALNRDEQTTRVWRSRGHIPPAVLNEVSRRSGKSVQWLTLAADTEDTTGTASQLSSGKSKKQVNLLTQDEVALVLELRKAPATVRQAIVTIIRHSAKEREST